MSAALEFARSFLAGCIALAALAAIIAVTRTVASF